MGARNPQHARKVAASTRKKLGADVTVDCASDDTDGAAVEAARESDVAVVVVATSPCVGPTRTRWWASLVKRSFLAHLIVFMALIGHLPALLYVWAYGSLAALGTALAVKGSLVGRVRVDAMRSAGAR